MNFILFTFRFASKMADAPPPPHYSVSNKIGIENKIQPGQINSQNNVCVCPVVTLWICNHVHCLCMCTRSHISKFQHYKITSNHFTACCVGSDITCDSRILLCGNITTMTIKFSE